MKRTSIVMASIFVLGIIGFSWFNQDNVVVKAQDVSPINESQAFLQDELNTIEIIETYGPSVVAINVEVRGERVNPFGNFEFELPPNFQLPPGFEDFFRNQQQQQDQGDPQEFRRQGSGSGFIISNQGRLITNFHVVENALDRNTATIDEDARITVTFPESEEDFAVKVIGVNPDFDLALLELENAADLPFGTNPIQLADSDAVKVGQKVIAIGNPFGLSSTVTAGIVSAISREVPSIGQVEVPMVQTDAAINPGNSGGPLLNSKGQLVGINTAIIPGISANGQRGNVGIGFAVPSNLLSENLEALEAGGVSGRGSVAILGRPRIGISGFSVENYPDAIKNRMELPTGGFVVNQVAPDGPADKAGIRSPSIFTEEDSGARVPIDADIIIEADGRSIVVADDLISYVVEKNAGDTLELKVWNDGEVRTIRVTLEVVNQ